MSKASTKQPGESRALLIAAGIKLFAKKGYDGTTTRDIVDETGLNISLIAYHFGGKEGLLDACLETAAQTVLGTATAGLVDASTKAEFRERVHDYAERFLKSHEVNPDMQRLVIKEIDRDSDSFRRVLKSSYVRMFETLFLFFKTAQKKGLVRTSLDPLTVALSLNGILVQHLRTGGFRKLFTGIGLDDAGFRKQLLDDVVTIFCQGIEEG